MSFSNVLGGVIVSTLFRNECYIISNSKVGISDDMVYR